MTNLKKNTVRATLIALMAAAPMSALATPQSGTPNQSVANDPDEYVEGGTIYTDDGGAAIVDSPKAEQGANMNADVRRNLEIEEINDSAKRDG